MDGLKLATLDTLQHRLTRDAESADRLTHREESFASLTVESGLEIVGEPDAPGRTGRDLLASDDAVVDETMNGRRCNAERGRRTFDGQQLTCSGVRIRDEARNLPVRPQAANTIALEAMTARRLAALPIEDAGDHSVGVVDCQAAHERDRGLIGAHSCWPRARQAQVDFGQCTALPAQREVGCRLIALDLDNHLLDQRTQQLLPVAWRGRGCGPYGGEVGTEGAQAIALLDREHAPALILATCQFLLRRLQRPAALLPRTLEAERDEPVVGIY